MREKSKEKKEKKRRLIVFIQDYSGVKEGLASRRYFGPKPSEYHSTWETGRGGYSADSLGD